MSTLVKPEDIAATVRGLKPTHVVTAYVGLNWKAYVDAEVLQSVVLSPTLGSNPAAIGELIRELGIERVHFLDHLHAKFYWTSTAALLGSCNLSDNGMQGEGGLLEAAVVLREKGQVAELRTMHDEIVSLANMQYPTPAKKYKRLADLEKLSQRASLGGIMGSGKGSSYRGVDLISYDFCHKRRIKIVPYSYDIELDGEAIEGAIYDAIPSDYTGFLENDDIREGDWILRWKVQGNGVHPVRNGPIEWMYADRVVQGGSRHKWYTKLAIQMRKRKPWENPFLITGDVKSSFRSLVLEQQFSSLLDPGNEPWSVEPADAVTKDFLQHLQQCVSNV